MLWFLYWPHYFKTIPATLVCMCASTAMSFKAVGCWEMVGKLIWVSIFANLLNKPHTKSSAVILIWTSPLQNHPCYVGMHVCKYCYEFQSCGVLGNGWEIDLSVHFHSVIKRITHKTKCCGPFIDLTTSKPVLLRWFACVQALLWISKLWSVGNWLGNWSECQF